MRRRTCLLSLGTGLTVGCLESARSRYPGSGPAPSSQSIAYCENGTRSEAEATADSGTTAEADGIRITGVFPAEVDRTFFDYEYVELTNEASSRVDASGYTLDYGDGREYTFPSVEVEPGAQVVVSSRSGDDVTLDRAPPIYHLFAGFGQGNDTSVLDATSGRLVLRDADGAVVDAYRYGEATRTTGC